MISIVICQHSYNIFVFFHGINSILFTFIIHSICVIRCTIHFLLASQPQYIILSYIVLEFSLKVKQVSISC